MASIIKIKRSTSASSIPGSLSEGELAVNLFDRKLYVGNSSGVTAISGENYEFTSQAASAGEGVYIKLKGESASTSNTVLFQPGEGVDITLQGNGSVLIAGEDATTANKGIASFSSDNFAVSSGAVTIKDGGIVNAEIANKTILNGKIADGTLSSTQIASKGISANSIADGTLSSTQIESKGIYANSIADGTITSTQIGAGAITANSLADGIITADLITDGSITGAKIANKGLFANSIADGVITSTQISAGGITANAIGNDSVALGTKTTGNYVATITGTANEVEVSGSGSETAAVTIGLPDDVTIGNDLTVTGDVSIDGTTTSTSTTTGALVVDGGLGVAENIFAGGNLNIAGNATIDGNLNVEGAVTYISSSTVNVDDSMLKLSANNSADTVDVGVYGKYVVSGNSAVQYTGYFRDATDGVFKFYTGLDVEPGQTVDVSDTGYSLAQLDAIIDGGTY